MESVLLEGVTLAFILFGALAIFLLRRWFSSARAAIPLAVAPVQCVALRYLRGRID
jgi:hypothetical protein